MPLPRTIIGFVAGAVVGAACAGLGIWLGSSDSEPVPTTLAASPSAQLDAEWARPGEVLIGPTALVPTSLGIEDGAAVLGYDLADIAPPALGSVAGSAAEDLPIAAPESWTLFTTSGELTGSTASVRARTARFPVPAGFGGTVTGARIDSWRVRMPLTHVVSVAHDDFGEHVLDDGTSIALRIILEQSNSTLVPLRVHSPSDLFSAATGSFTAAFEAQPQLSGVGTGWTNIGQIEGGVQLTYLGGVLPDPFQVRVRTHDWVPLERPIAVDLGGLTLG